MADRTAPDAAWERKVERRLSRRLQDHAEDLDLGEESARGGGLGGVEGRGRLVTAWVEAYRRHCAGVLADLAGTLEEAGAGTPAVSWLAARFGAHADEVLARTLRALAEHGGGAPVTAAERHRFANLASAVKAESRGRLEEAAARLERHAALSPGEAPAGEADDRLPLYRRGAFDRDLREMARAAQEGGEPLGLAMVDLDHFKKVNDEHGHPVGDEVLLAVAQIVVRVVRGKGRAYRYGGEEIALLLPNYGVEEAAALAERIRREIAAAPVGSRRLPITASFGVACAPGRAGGAEGLLEKADQALYDAKRSGRNCVRTAAPSG